MSEPKTKITGASVARFISTIPNPEIRNDCRIVAEIMETATKAKPRMWGTNIVGFGEHRSVYSSGREANWMITGFSPRKQSITLYIMDGLERHHVLLT